MWVSLSETERTVQRRFRIAPVRRLPGWISRVEERLGPEQFRYTSAVNHPAIVLGTSSFTSSGWNGSFYLRGMKPSDYLAKRLATYNKYLSIGVG
jgi:hypothetical protein